MVFIRSLLIVGMLLAGAVNASSARLTNQDKFKALHAKLSPADAERFDRANPIKSSRNDWGTLLKNLKAFLPIRTLIKTSSPAGSRSSASPRSHHLSEGVAAPAPAPAAVRELFPADAKASPAEGAPVHVSAPEPAPEATKKPVEVAAPAPAVAKELFPSDATASLAEGLSDHATASEEAGRIAEASVETVLATRSGEEVAPAGQGSLDWVHFDAEASAPAVGPLPPLPLPSAHVADGDISPLPGNAVGDLFDSEWSTEVPVFTAEQPVARPLPSTPPAGSRRSSTSSSVREPEGVSAAEHRAALGSHPEGSSDLDLGDTEAPAPVASKPADEDTSTDVNASVAPQGSKVKAIFRKVAPSLIKFAAQAKVKREAEAEAAAAKKAAAESTQKPPAVEIPAPGPGVEGGFDSTKNDGNKPKVAKPVEEPDANALTPEEAAKKIAAELAEAQGQDENAKSDIISFFQNPAHQFALVSITAGTVSLAAAIKLIHNKWLAEQNDPNRSAPKVEFKSYVVKQLFGTVNPKEVQTYFKIVGALLIVAGPVYAAMSN